MLLVMKMFYVNTNLPSCDTELYFCVMLTVGKMGVISQGSLEKQSQEDI